MLDVAIVGGGIGGLALAAGLVRKGYKTRLYEAAPALRTSTGTVVVLGTNAFSALAPVHPASVPQIKACGARVQRMSRLVRCNKHEPVREIPGPVMGELHNVRWSEVQRVLASLVPEDHVQCNHRATGYTENADDGFATVHFENQADVSARFVVAADGIRSALRATMIPSDPGPKYAGSMYWNALLYNPDGRIADLHVPGEIQAWTDSPSPGDYKHQMVLTDAGGGFTSWHLMVHYDEPAFTPLSGREVQPDSTQQLMGRSAVRRPGSKARLLKMMEGAGFENPLKAVQATPEKDILERAIMHHIPLDELGVGMSSPGGRMLLLGDAAHAMHPGLGQGARTAFEDVYTLLRTLESRRDALVKGGWDITPLNLDLDNGKAEHGGSGDGSKLHTRSQKLGADKEAVQAVAHAYEEARLARVCCIQRVSSDLCGIAALKQAVRPAGLDTPQRMQWYNEFNKWLNQFPDKAQGDPDSTYFTPAQVRTAPVVSKEAFEALLTLLL